MRGVRAKNLSVWIGSREVVKELDFEMESGTLWLVSGDCGTGKTTLARVVVGLAPELYRGYRVSGVVEVFGYRPADALRRGLVAYVPQDISLATLTTSAAEELFIYGLHHRVPELRRLVGDLMFREIRKLSAGERFRVLTGLSLLLNKKLVVVDEPSGYLDPETLGEVLEVLRDYAVKSGSVVVVLDHKLGYYASKVDGMIDLGSKTRCSNSRLTTEASRGVLLEARNLGFRYSNTKVFDGLDLRVDSGMVVAVVGSNGSGKTTLLRVLLGLLKPSSGIVRRHYRRAFYVPQLSSYWMNGDVVSALKALGCDPSVIGLVGVSNTSSTALSLGEIRRLSVYAGIYGTSDLVVVDEVSLGLDDTSIECVSGAFNEARRAGKSVVFSTHDARVARFLGPDIVVKLS
ncbi:MAG: ATP-binding cassette domain-containing protein [Sulfolobales archaeon]